MTHALNIVWSPSEGIDLGFFIIRYYSLMFVIAFGLGWYIMTYIFERENVHINRDALFVCIVLATLIGARLGHVFFYDWEYYRNNLTAIVLPFRFNPTMQFTGYQGLASHGGVLGVIIALYFYSKKVLHRPVLWILDRVVIVVASGAFFVRWGNFFNSEIVGKKTTSSFGIRFIREQFSPGQAISITKLPNPKDAYYAIATNPKYANVLEEVPLRHPVQLYEAFCYLIIFTILFFLYRKTDSGQRLGFLFGIFLVLTFTVRIIVELVKETQGGFESKLGNILSTGQWLSIPFILVGLYFTLKAKKDLA